MRYSLVIGLLACTEYELKSPATENILPIEDSAVPLEPLSPIAVAGPSNRVKRNIEIALSGENSYDPDDENASLIYEWTLEQSPEGSTVSLSATDIANPVFSADLLGEYIFSLQVTDEEGLVSEYKSATLIEVVPYEDLIVSVSWGTAVVDVDLHLLNAAGTYYGEGDCFFGNPTPDWGEEGNILDNPELILDDEGSENSESIVLGQPQEEIYRIYIHFYNQRENSEPWVTPTLEVSAEGNLLASFEGPRMIGEGTVWMAGTVDWSTLTFVQDTTMSDHISLGGPVYND